MKSIETQTNAAREAGQKQLSDYIGQAVTVQNIAHVQMDDGRLQFKFDGVLEAPVDDDPNYLLRIKESYDGTSSICFNERHLAAEDGIFRQPSGRIEITLK